MRSSALTLGATLASILVVAACDRGGFEDQTLKVVSLNIPMLDAPTHVIKGDRATLSLWSADIFGASDQAVYRTTDGRIQIRVIIDPTLHVPTTIIDEINGYYIQVKQRDDGGVDFRRFSPADTYLAGIAVIADGDTYQLGTLTGRPAFLGQIQAQLSTGTAGTGSFAVIASPTALLADLEDVTEDLTPLLTLLDGAPIIGDDGLPVDQPLQARTFTLGALVIAGARTEELGDAYVAAGVTAALAGLYSDQLGALLDADFVTSDAFIRELLDIAAADLRFRPRDHAAFFAEIVARAKRLIEIPPAIDDPTVDPENGLTVIRELVDAYDDQAPYLAIEQQPAPYDEPVARETPITGQAVWSDNAVDPISGRVDENGIVTIASSNPSSGTPLVQVTGAVSGEEFSGAYTRGEETGSAVGLVKAVGACSVINESGGEGTFTNVHFVGFGSGNITFTYDAFSIPDAFNVSVSGAIVFSTNGLVSGFMDVEIPVAGEQFVFVSVSAPNSGTAWEYQLGCLP